MRAIAADLRSGFLVLRRYPMLSTAAIVTLGLGLGLSTMVFCIVNGALFSSLPLPEPARVVALLGERPSTREDQLSIAVQDLPLWEARLTMFDVFGAYGTIPVNLSGDDRRPERVSAGQLTLGAFRALGVRPILGRGFQAGDDGPGARPVALISDEIWRDRFGRAPDVLHRTIRASGVPTEIVGVMPARFGFPGVERLWLPLHVDPRATPRGAGPAYPLVGRLKPGVSLAEARAQVAAVAGGLEREFPETNRGLTATVTPFTELVLGRDGIAVLYTMLGAGIGVLVIACVNVSNLLVARASLRRREVAVRIALGARPGTIVRQHLTEVLILSAIGAVLGVAIAAAGVGWFNDALTLDPPPFWMSFGVDGRVVAFVAGLIVLAAAAAGALPALDASRVAATAALKDDSRSSTSGRLGRTSAVLVVVELALSCGLLIAAGLMVKSVVQLRHVKMPFATDRVITMRLDLPHDAYPDNAAARRFADRLLTRLTATPGVAAAVSDLLPGAGTWTSPIRLDGRAYAQPSDYPNVRKGIVTASYFDTYRVSPVRGRLFATADTASSEPVVVVNESFARAFYPTGDAIGHRLAVGRDAAWRTIVGVVPDLQMQGIGDPQENPAGFYLPFAQAGGVLPFRLIVRVTGEDEAGALRLAESAIAAIDRDLPAYEVLSMTQVIRRETWFFTVFGTFFAGFGVSALLLAAAGLYGVISFAVTVRTREMGVRAALGARGPQLVWLIMRRSLIQLAIGLILGLAIGRLSADPLALILYRVNPRDPVVAALVAGVLAGTALAASFLPAWRVTRINPVTAVAAE